MCLLRLPQNVAQLYLSNRSDFIAQPHYSDGYSSQAERAALLKLTAVQQFTSVNIHSHKASFD